MSALVFTYPGKSPASNEKLLVSMCLVGLSYAKLESKGREMKHFALSAEVGREASLVPEASPLKAFHNLGFCTCLYVVNWQMLAFLLGDTDYQRKWPPLIELKVDFLFSLNKYGGR